MMRALLIMLVLTVGTTACSSIGLGVDLRAKYIMGYEHELDRSFNMFTYGYETVDKYVKANDIASIEVYYHSELIGEVLPSDNFTFYFILDDDGYISYNTSHTDLKEMIKFVLKNYKD